MPTAGDSPAGPLRLLRDLRSQLRANTDAFLENLEASVEGVPKTREELLVCLQRASKDSVLQVVMQYSSYLVKEAKRSAAANKLVLKHMKTQLDDLAAALRRKNLETVENLKLLLSAHDTVRINFNLRADKLAAALEDLQDKLLDASKTLQPRRPCAQCSRSLLELEHLRRTLDSKIQQEVHLVQALDYEKKRSERLARELKDAASKLLKPGPHSADKPPPASEQLKQALVKIHAIDHVLKETKREYEQKIAHLVDCNTRLQLQLDAVKAKDKIHTVSTQHTSTRMPPPVAEASIQRMDKETQTAKQQPLDTSAIIERLASRFEQLTAAVEQKCSSMHRKCESVEQQSRRYVSYILRVAAQNRQMKALQYIQSKEVGVERSRAERFYRDANKYKNEIEAALQAHKEVLRQNDLLNTEVAHLKHYVEKLNKPKNLKKIVQDMNSIVLEKDLKLADLEHRLKLRDAEATAATSESLKFAGRLRSLEDACGKLVLFVRYLADKYDGNIKAQVFQLADHLLSHSAAAFEQLYPQIDRWHVLAASSSADTRLAQLRQANRSLETRAHQLQLEVCVLRQQMASLVPAPREVVLVRELVSSIECGSEEEVWAAVRGVLSASLRGDEARAARVLSALQRLADGVRN